MKLKIAPGSVSAKNKSRNNITLFPAHHLNNESSRLGDPEDLGCCLFERLAPFHAVWPASRRGDRPVKRRLASHVAGGDGCIPTLFQCVFGWDDTVGVIMYRVATGQ